MNTCRANQSDHATAPLSQRLIEALAKLQAQEPHPNKVSVHIYDAVEQRTLFASCSTATLLGYTAEAIGQMGAVGLADLIHPDDLDVVAEHYQRFTSLKWGEVITVNYRMRRVDGAWCLIYSQDTPLVWGKSNFPVQIVGMVQVLPQVAVPTLDDLLCRAGFSGIFN